jgi:hypothetical protein
MCNSILHRKYLEKNSLKTQFYAIVENNYWNLVVSGIPLGYFDIMFLQATLIMKAQRKNTTSLEFC